MSNIPSDEDVARADRLAEERSRNLDKVADAVKRKFANVCPLHNIYILPQRDVNFRAYIFLEKDMDLESCERSGVKQRMMDCVFTELELAGRGKRSDTTVAFEWDSHENVLTNFEGDYFLRLQ